MSLFCRPPPPPPKKKKNKTSKIKTKLEYLSGSKCQLIGQMYFLKTMVN